VIVENIVIVGGVDRVYLSKGSRIVNLTHVGYNLRVVLPLHII